VPIAAERLAPYPQVDLRFGDATVLLPSLVESGDVVMIDGPKGHRGIRLALSLLATGKPALVLVHDTNKGSPERRLLEALLPETVYSDDADFAEHTHLLDAAAGDDIPAANRYGTQSAVNGYGFSLACIPFNAERNYRWLLIRSIVDGLLYRLFRRG
jgi:DNA-binding transcriptional LysR family regulator